MRILVVEDERKAAAYLAKGLSENGFVVDTAKTGDDGLFQATTIEYDLIVLDVMLPGRDGWSILKEFRAKGKQTPVLMLTARADVEDRVKGLELGADDYLVKPFAFSELLARIRTILRRSPARSSEHLHVGDMQIDLHKRKVIRAGQTIDLTPIEFGLLAYLARRVGEVQSRTLIAEQVWDMNFDPESNVVDVHIRRLRAKIDDPFDVKLIHTVRGVGYVIETRE